MVKPFLFPRAEMGADVERGENPGGMPLVPFYRTVRQEAAQIVQNEVAPERQLDADDVEAAGRSSEGRKVPAGEVVEAGGGQVTLVGGIDVGVMRAKVR